MSYSTINNRKKKENTYSSIFPDWSMLTKIVFFLVVIGSTLFWVIILYSDYQYGEKTEEIPIIEGCSKIDLYLEAEGLPIQFMTKDNIDTVEIVYTYFMVDILGFETTQSNETPLLYTTKNIDNETMQLYFSENKEMGENNDRPTYYYYTDIIVYLPEKFEYSINLTSASGDLDIDLDNVYITQLYATNYEGDVEMALESSFIGYAEINAKDGEISIALNNTWGSGDFILQANYASIQVSINNSSLGLNYYETNYGEIETNLYNTTLNHFKAFSDTGKIYLDLYDAQITNGIDLSTDIGAVIFSSYQTAIDGNITLNSDIGSVSSYIDACTITNGNLLSTTSSGEITLRLFNTKWKQENIQTPNIPLLKIYSKTGSIDLNEDNSTYENITYIIYSVSTETGSIDVSTTGTYSVEQHIIWDVFSRTGSIDARIWLYNKPSEIMWNGYVDSEEGSVEAIGFSESFTGRYKVLPSDVTQVNENLYVLLKSIKGSIEVDLDFLYTYQ